MVQGHENGHGDVENIHESQRTGECVRSAIADPGNPTSCVTVQCEISSREVSETLLMYLMAAGSDWSGQRYL